MNWFKQVFDETAQELTPVETLQRFRASIEPDWIQQALQLTGAATVRRRRLPAEQVIWLVLGMALMRDLPMDQVVAKLDLALPGSGTRLAKSAIPPARQRLGSEPMKKLFELTARQWALQSAAKYAWRNLSVFAADGTTFRLPDSEDNRTTFGLADGGNGPSSYPLARAVCIMATRSHLMLAADIGEYKKGEHALLDDCIAAVPDNSLLILDKFFTATKYKIGISQRGVNRHWLIRVKKGARWRVVEDLGTEGAIVELVASAKARKLDPSLPKQFKARALCYQFPGSETENWLLTSLLDSQMYPAKEIAALYHERWDIELAYDELKTDLLQREETLRSRSSQGVYQEFWGTLIAYNLVRFEMQGVAEEVKLPPTRISFVMSLRTIRYNFLAMSFNAPGAIPKRLRRMREELKEFILPPRRSKRRYPRAVKIHRSKYPRKPRPTAIESPKETSDAAITGN